jgi:hypothetical protein
MNSFSLSLIPDFAIRSSIQEEDIVFEGCASNLQDMKVLHCSPGHYRVVCIDEPASIDYRSMLPSFALTQKKVTEEKVKTVEKLHQKPTLRSLRMVNSVVPTTTQSRDDLKQYHPLALAPLVLWRNFSKVISAHVASVDKCVLPEYVHVTIMYLRKTMSAAMAKSRILGHDEQGRQQWRPCS